MRVGFLLHDVARYFRYRFDERARGLGVTRPQWRALLTLARLDGPSQSELAEELEVERITLCRMVDRLAESGLVERRADPNDRRVWRLHLTDTANEIVGQLGEIGLELEEEALARLDERERVMLVEMLSRIADELRRDEPRCTGKSAT